MRFTSSILLILASTVLAHPGGMFSTPSGAPSAPSAPSTPAAGQVVNVQPKITNFPMEITKDVAEIPDVGFFAKSLSMLSTSNSRIYNFTRSLTQIPYHAGVVLGNIGGVLAAPTVVGTKVFAPWRRENHAINWWGTPVLEKAGKAGAILGLPLFLVSLPFIGTSILLHLTKMKFDEVFTSAEAYQEYLKYINSEMGALYKIANGKPIDQAVNQILAQLKNNATPELIKATQKWIEMNPEKVHAKSFKAMLETVDKDKLKKEMDVAITKAAENEKQVIADAPTKQ